MEPAPILVVVCSEIFDLCLTPPALTVPGVDEAGPESLETPRHLHILRADVPRPTGFLLALPEPPDGLPAEDVAGPSRHVDLLRPRFVLPVQAVSITPAPPQSPGYQGGAGVEVAQHRLQVLHDDKSVVVRLENPVVVPGQLFSLQEHLLGFTPEFLSA